jgi:tetratricopeptide (TPR) repeat protein
MKLSSNPREIIVISFVAVTIGFLGGYTFAPRGGGGGAGMDVGMAGAPHTVGAAEFVQLGMQALGSGDFPGAEGLFRQAVELEPDNLEARTDLALSLMYQERWLEAIAEVEVVKQRNPGLPETLFLEGVISRDGLRDPERARAAWEAFLTLVPEDSPQAETVKSWLEELSAGPPTESTGS